MLTPDTPARRAAAGPLRSARLLLVLGLAIMFGSATVYSQDLAVFKDASGNVVASIDQDGRFSTKGKFIATSGPIALLSGTQYYSVKDSTGKVYFAIDLETGDTSVLTTGGAGSTASTPFVLKSATGVPVFQLNFGEVPVDFPTEISPFELPDPPQIWPEGPGPVDIDWAKIKSLFSTVLIYPDTGGQIAFEYPLAQARIHYTLIGGTASEWDYICGQDHPNNKVDVTDKSWRLKFRKTPDNVPFQAEQYEINLGFRHIEAASSQDRNLLHPDWDLPLSIRHSEFGYLQGRLFANEQDMVVPAWKESDGTISILAMTGWINDETKTYPFTWQPPLKEPGVHVLEANVEDDNFTHYHEPNYFERDPDSSSEPLLSYMTSDPIAPEKSMLFLYDMEFIQPDHLPTPLNPSSVFVGFNLLPLFRHGGMDGVDMKKITLRISDVNAPVCYKEFEYTQPAGGVHWNGRLKNASTPEYYPVRINIEAKVEWSIPDAEDSIRKPWQQEGNVTESRDDGKNTTGKTYYYFAPDCFVDLDVDSNNNGGIEQQVAISGNNQEVQYYLPDTNFLVDDLVENLAQEPGLLLGINNDDDNGDGQQDRLDNQLNSGTGADHDDLDDTEKLRLKTAPLLDTDDVILKVATPNLVRIFAPISNTVTASDYKVVLKPAHSTITLKHGTALADPDNPNTPLLTIAQVDNLRTKISGADGCEFRIEGFAQGREKIELKVQGANGKNGKDEVIVTVIGISKISSHYYGPVVASDMDHVADGATDVSDATVYARAPIYLSEGVHARLNEYLVAPSNTMADTASPQNPHEKNPCYVVMKIGPEILSGDDQSRFIDSNGDYKLGVSTDQNYWTQLNEANFMAHVGNFSGSSVNGTPTDENTINYYRWSFDPQSRQVGSGPVPESSSRPVNVEPELDLISFDHIVKALGLTDDDLGGTNGTRYIKSGLYFFNALGISTPGEQRISIQRRWLDSEGNDIRVDRAAGENVVTVLGVNIEATAHADGWILPLLNSDPNPTAYITNNPNDSNFPYPPDILVALTNKDDYLPSTLTDGTVQWSLDIEFVRGRTRTTNNAHIFYSQPRHIQDGELPPSGTDGLDNEFTTYGDTPAECEARKRTGRLVDTFTEEPIPVDEDWYPYMYDSNNEPIIRGGTATFKFAYTVPATAGTPGGILTGRRAVQIRGFNPPSGVGNGNTILNPAADSIVSYIDTLDTNYWYARFIFAHESDQWHQFNGLENSGYKIDLGPNFANIHGGGMPNWGYPDGWGIAQRDPFRSLDNVWNWKQNIVDGFTELSQKRALSPFGNMPKKNNVPITTGLPNSVSVNGHSFTLSGDADGHFTYWDLDTIKQYNGGKTFVYNSGTWTIDPSFNCTLNSDETVGTVFGV
jgi:hypothetical protein